MTSSLIIQDTADLKKMSLHELENLAQEIRQKIISVCLKNGGHLGASLGAVEIAISLHRTFHSPEEPILWDVGHQAYAHKLLTGRWTEFETLRQDKGLSGFPSPNESVHDRFFVGHSSTALSSALALSWENQKWTVAVVGDGSLSAGLSFEAINNLRTKDHGPMLVVLNDNQMSISASHGGMAGILSGGKAAEFFSFFGFDYVGPVDGHDLNQLVGLMEGIRANYQGKPILLHVITQKGRGYAPAEELPSQFHGIAPREQKTEAKTGKQKASPSRSFSQVFGETICKLAKVNPNLVAITAAMPEGTGLSQFSKEHAERFFDVGIAEQHAVTFGGALAVAGKQPVIAIYSTFLQRAMDSVIHDVALQSAPVIFAIDRGGLVGADGPTHHGAFDLAFLSAIPNFEVHAPADGNDLRKTLEDVVLHPRTGPVAIRFPRGSVDPIAVDNRRLVCGSPKGIVIGVGHFFGRVMHIQNAIIHGLTQVKPFSETWFSQLVDDINSANLPVLIVEPGIKRGGVGEALAAKLSEGRIKGSLKIKILALPDRFISHGGSENLDEEVGLSESAIERSYGELVR